MSELQFGSQRDGDNVQLPVNDLYCSGVRGTTESLPILTSGEAENSLLALIAARATGLASGFPAAISICGFLGFGSFTETTDAVPTADLLSPVSYMTNLSPVVMAARFRRATGLCTPSQTVFLSFCRSAKEYSLGSVFSK